MNPELGHQHNQGPENSGLDESSKEYNPENDPLGLFTNNPTPEQRANEEELRRKLNNPNDPLGIRAELERMRTGREKTSLNDIAEKTQKWVIACVRDLLESKQDIIDKYEQALTHYRTLGENGASLFNFLAKHGLAKPDKEYEHNAPQGYYAERIKKFNTHAAGLKDRLSKAKLRSMVAARLNLDYAPIAPARHEQIRDDLGGVKEQRFFQRLPIANTPLVVEEFVFNYPKNTGNWSSASLRMMNKASGQVLDLEQLLPKGCRFSPGQMRNVQKKYDPENDKVKIVRDNVDLNTYSGTQDTKGDFYASPADGIVSYGNLAEKGGRLKLLHEIAHTWQFKHRSNFGRLNYESFFKDVMFGLWFMELCKSRSKNSTNDTAKQMWEDEKKQLGELGVEIDSENFVFKGQPLKEGEYKVSAVKMDPASPNLKLKPQQFVFKSERLKPLVEDYVNEERDAWAHAIRVLRYFRRQGLDLEPELKTTGDILDIVHYALGTYQASIEQEIEPTKDIRKFTNKSRFKP